jgi:hypothetical protein
MRIDPFLLKPVLYKVYRVRSGRVDTVSGYANATATASRPGPRARPRGRSRSVVGRWSLRACAVDGRRDVQPLVGDPTGRNGTGNATRSNFIRYRFYSTTARYRYRAIGKYAYHY